MKKGLETKLSDFVGAESLFIFDRLNIKREWLDKPVDTWKNYESFTKMETYVRTVLVTNDS